jgi:AAA+ superfamily predicted ATPase
MAGATDIPSPSRPKAFKTIDVLLEAAQFMFVSRFRARVPDGRQRNRERVRKLAGLWARSFWKSYDRTGDGIMLVRKCRAVNLSVLETEIVLALVLAELRMARVDMNCLGDLLEYLGVMGARALEVHRMMAGAGGLRDALFVLLPDPDEFSPDKLIQIDPCFVQDVVANHDTEELGWRVKTEEDLLKQIKRFALAFHRPTFRQRDSFFEKARMRPSSREYGQRLWAGFHTTLKAHPDWHVSRFFQEHDDLSIREQVILTLLMCRELGHIAGDEECSASTLASCMAERDSDGEGLLLFHPDAALVSQGLIHPSLGSSQFLTDDPKELADVEFELSKKSLEALNLQRHRLKKHSGERRVRAGNLKLDHLVLGDEVIEKVRMALAHVRHHAVLMQEWGLAERFPYGRGVTMLFSGPPGVGKTALAEAMATEMGKPILVADYTEIQSCWVGNTEKNISKVFSEAKAQDAVLFWDEADAMFHDRDAGLRTFEVRDVNVLLQQIERFDGVCILATNRVITLDKALERRISTKIVFERPNRLMRSELWKRLLPERLPRAADVDLEGLADFDFSGGEIKNVILNAARRALTRGAEGPVTMADLLSSAEAERKGKWTADGGERIGF